MSIIISDNKGFITQIIKQAEGTLDALAEKYTDMGISNIRYEGEVSHDDYYVKHGLVLPRPEIDLRGYDPQRRLIANNEDSITLRVDQQPCTFTVYHNGVNVFSGPMSDGLELSVDTAGVYQIHFDSGWPYHLKKVEVWADEA